MAGPVPKPTPELLAELAKERDTDKQRRAADELAFAERAARDAAIALALARARAKG